VTIKKSFWISNRFGAGLPVIAGPGGLPIIRRAGKVGAIGVFGSATDQQDEQCAKAGVEALDETS
jgi:uncharacterized protein GlcG (DUF336 family)